MRNMMPGKRFTRLFQGTVLLLSLASCGYSAGDQYGNTTLVLDLIPTILLIVVVVVLIHILAMSPLLFSVNLSKPLPQEIDFVRLSPCPECGAAFYEAVIRPGIPIPEDDERVRFRGNLYRVEECLEEDDDEGTTLLLERLGY